MPYFFSSFLLLPVTQTTLNEAISFPILLKRHNTCYGVQVLFAYLFIERHSHYPVGLKCPHASHVKVKVCGFQPLPRFAALPLQNAPFSMLHRIASSPE